MVRAVLFASIILGSVAASAQRFVTFVDRPIALPRGQWEVSLDFLVGLDRGLEGRVVGPAASLAWDRYSGLSVAAGVAHGLELGLAGQFLSSDVPKARQLAGWPYSFDLSSGNSHLVPLYVYAKYEVLEVLGVELGFMLPPEQLLGNNRPALRLGLPVRLVLSPGLLCIHLRPDLILGFGDPDNPALVQREAVQVSVYGDLGITLNLLPELFFDVTGAYGRTVHPDGHGYVPISFAVGCTPLYDLDVIAGFTLEDVASGVSSRNISVGVKYRF